MTRAKLLLVVAVIAWLLSACSSATSRARVQPSDVVTELVRFHGAVAEQMQEGGMELEHFLTVTSWIGDTLRVVRTNPSQWEGQARLRWPVVKSIGLSFENLAEPTHRIQALIE